METPAIRSVGNAVRIDVLVVPNASRSHVVGPHGDRVKIRISAPREKGKVNKELLALLTAATGARTARIVSGDLSRHKTIELTGVSAAQARAHLTHPT